MKKGILELREEIIDAANTIASTAKDKINMTTYQEIKNFIQEINDDNTLYRILKTLKPYRDFINKRLIADELVPLKLRLVLDKHKPDIFISLLDVLSKNKVVTTLSNEFRNLVITNEFNHSLEYHKVLDLTQLDYILYNSDNEVSDIKDLNMSYLASVFGSFNNSIIISNKEILHLQELMYKVLKKKSNETKETSETSISEYIKLLNIYHNSLRIYSEIDYTMDEYKQRALDTIKFLLKRNAQENENKEDTLKTLITSVLNNANILNFKENNQCETTDLEIQELQLKLINELREIKSYYETINEVSYEFNKCLQAAINSLQISISNVYEIKSTKLLDLAYEIILPYKKFIIKSSILNMYKKTVFKINIKQTGRVMITLTSIDDSLELDDKFKNITINNSVISTLLDGNITLKIYNMKIYDTATRTNLNPYCKDLILLVSRETLIVRDEVKLKLLIMFSNHLKTLGITGNNIEYAILHVIDASLNIVASISENNSEIKSMRKTLSDNIDLIKKYKSSLITMDNTLVSYRIDEINKNSEQAERRKTEIKLENLVNTTLSIYETLLNNLSESYYLRESREK